MQHTEIKRKISPKQALALKLLNDKVTEELVYGGGAGGGKSRLFSQFAIDMSLRYPETRGLIGRESLKDLKQTTLLSFFDQCKEDGLKEDRDYVYYQDSHILFPQTKSIIFLAHLGWMPSDPQYDRLGSYEITWSLIDEGQQIERKAKDILKARTRYKLDEYDLIPKQGISCNPANNWIKTDFYNPWREGRLKPHEAFVPALVVDNPFAAKSYVETLRKLPPYDRERLLYGNWDYDDDPSRMISFDAITDVYSNIVTPIPKENFIIVDAARMGADYMTVSYWEGFVCRKIAGFRRKKTTEAVTIIEQWREAYKVPRSFTLVDEGGVGGGVVDQGGYKGFIAARRAFNPNYLNLRAECSFKLAELVEARKIRIETENPDIRKWITQDLEQIRRKDPDKDGKLAIISKDRIKERIGRSPDWGDNLMMRMWYECSPRPNIHII